MYKLVCTCCHHYSLSKKNGRMYMYKIDIYFVTLLDKCLLFYLIFLSLVSNKCSFVCLIYVRSTPLTVRILGGSKGSEEEEEDVGEAEGTVE
jgi:hypothetical protein